eukprot:jgi/Bigna1/139203/aug1.49_g13911
MSMEGEEEDDTGVSSSSQYYSRKSSSSSVVSNMRDKRESKSTYYWNSKHCSDDDAPAAATSFVDEGSNRGNYNGFSSSSSTTNLHNSRRLNSQDLANSLWAMAVLGRMQSPIFRALWDKGQECMQWDTRELVQLYEVYAFVAGEGPMAAGNPKKVPLRWNSPKIRKRAREECARIQALEKQTTSRFHLSVAAALDRMNISHINERRIGTWSIDIHITEPGLEHIIIEADGPTHYLHNSTRNRKAVRNGPALLKHRALADLGWTIVTVPYFEWNECSNAAMEMAYMQSVLREAVLRKQNVVLLFDQIADRL